MADTRKHRFLVKRHDNAMGYDEMTAREVVDRAEALANLLRPFVDQEDRDEHGTGVLSHEATDAIVEAYVLAEDLDRHMPSVLAYRVLKVYADEGWRPAVWFGCQTQAQAEKLRTACEEHYARPQDRPHTRDLWIVDYGPVRPLDLVKPTYTAAMFRRSHS